MMMDVLVSTPCGMVRGIENESCHVFRGLRYAHAERFRYAVPVTHWDGVLDTLEDGPACPQDREKHANLADPHRLFYHKEFREGIPFIYDEDCLHMNIFTPKEPGPHPVIVYIYGGGFNCGANNEGPFDGSSMARRGIITVFISYRVNVLGYLAHPQIQAETGRDGNFGLDDQHVAIRWVKANIAAFGGDPENITIMGQSAGAISVQYLCLNPANRNLFQHAVMLSGAGLFPFFARPRKAEEVHDFWAGLLEVAGCATLDELRAMDKDSLGDALFAHRALRKDAFLYTMPVIDGYLLPKPVDQLIQNPLHVDYLLGVTNNDMYAPLLARTGMRFARQTGAYAYYFDMDAPGGDGNAAFHSCELRYAFETLDQSWRPYGPRDYEASDQFASYLANFARTGSPNGPGLPYWQACTRHSGERCLHFGPEKTGRGKPDYLQLAHNWTHIGDPKAQV